QVGQFCEEQGIDAWYHKAGYLNVSTSPAQDGDWLENVEAMERAGITDDATDLDPGQVAGICRSPRFRGGVRYRAAATVQPARLGVGMRKALIETGVELFENSPVLSVDDGPGGVTARTADGWVTAEKLVLASGPSLAGRGSPHRHNVTIASSHMVITE